MRKKKAKMMVFTLHTAGNSDTQKPIRKEDYRRPLGKDQYAYCTGRMNPQGRGHQCPKEINLEQNKKTPTVATMKLKSPLAGEASTWEADSD